MTSHLSSAAKWIVANVIVFGHGQENRAVVRDSDLRLQVLKETCTLLVYRLDQTVTPEEVEAAKSGLLQALHQASPSTVYDITITGPIQKRQRNGRVAQGYRVTWQARPELFK